MIDPPNCERQSFAQVAKDHPEFGILIEQPAGHETKGVDRSFYRESPD